MRVLLITGPSGAVQGWGDYETTQNICNSIIENGFEAEILFVQTMDDLINGLNTMNYDLIWSALYHISSNENYIGMASAEPWIADILEEKGIPYIGPSAITMKNLIDKSSTNNILQKANIPVPKQYIVELGESIELDSFPWIVKPCFESESNGISEKSIVHNQDELNRMIQFIHSNFSQRALVEEYLPGKELTVTVLGNGYRKRVLPVENVINENAYLKYPLVTNDLKVKDLIFFEIPKNVDEAIKLAEMATDALDCYDHIRIDMRENANKQLNIIEVNGIPGLNPIKSRSLQIHSIYFPKDDKKENFNSLIKEIINSAIQRYKLVI